MRAGGASYAYVDNAAVDAGAKARVGETDDGVRERFAEERGLKEIWTHVHCENLGARALYHAFGFRAPSGTFPGKRLAQLFQWRTFERFNTFTSAGSARLHG